MTKYKHLTYDQRLQIQVCLSKNKSFKSIARHLGKDCTTISKEIKNHLIYKKSGSSFRPFNDCSIKRDCSQTHLCAKDDCMIKLCKNCSTCYTHCLHYQKLSCPLLEKPPYVCNGCDKRSGCTLEKHLYSAQLAQSEYELNRSESRAGVSISEDESIRLDSLISPLIIKGQSIHSICINNKDSIMYSEKSIYNYVDQGMFSARNIDLPRKVRYRPRKSKHDSFKVDKACRTNRTYEDALIYLKEHPDTPITELDSVEGKKGGKVLLTIHFVEAEFMLAFLRDSNTSQSVIETIDKLYWELRPDVFQKLFKFCLTDNGSEFSNPNAIEFDKEGNRRTYIFYCDPSAPYQKGAAENNHALIRRVLPKGTSFDNLTQEKVQLMMNHINSYARKKLGDLTPYEMMRKFHGVDVLKILGAVLIPPQDVTLHPGLLK